MTANDITSVDDSRTFGLSQRALALVMAAFLVVTGALLLFKLRDFFHDDAFISLRYARHLALNGELAWNLGERVEGYTNLLHVLASAALIRLGLDAMVAAHLINFTALAVLILVGWRLAGLATRAPELRLAALLPAISIPTVGWAFGGLEADLSAAFIALALLCAAPVLTGRDRIAPTLLASACFAIAYLTRPDAVVANFATGLAILAVAPLPLGRRVRQFVAVGMISALVLVAHLAIRQHYYGEWLPLTFYAKVGVETASRLRIGMLYAGTALIMLPALIALLPLAALRRGTGKPVTPALRLAQGAGLILLVQVAYIVWSGGDHMNFTRIFVPAIPALILCFAGLLAETPVALARGLALGLGAFALVQAAILPHEDADPAAYFGAVMAEVLNREFPEPRVVSLATAGSTPYFADQHTYIDQLGLNDPVIAKRQNVPTRSLFQIVPGHGKGDGAYVLSRKPDLIIFGTADGQPTVNPKFLTDYEMLEDPTFKACYVERTFRMDPPDPFPLAFPKAMGMPEYVILERVCD